MPDIKLKLPDESVRTVPSGTTALEVLEDFPSSLKKSALAVRLNDNQLDLTAVLTESGDFTIITGDTDEGLEIIRHSSAHLMAMAVKSLFPGTKLTIGPTIENGFYYDFDSEHVFTPEDFEAIENKMLELSRANISINRQEMKKEEAIEYYKNVDPDPYKVELIEEFTTPTVSFYHQGDFSDLCRGPHVNRTSQLQHFKLLNVAGSYWRGDSSRPMLQRIYATAFNDKKALKNYLNFLEEAKKRDHRVLGKALDYFHLDGDSPGMVFWHPKGWRLYRTIERYVSQKIEENGYDLIKTPEVVGDTLFQKSGHLDKFSEMMFQTTSEEKNYVIKPMNCPCHIEVFKSGTKSFRDLPIRLAEFGKCHRNELAGTMHGLMRVRGFVQDDAHIFCTQDQITSEVSEFCRLLKEVYKDFGFEDILVKFSDRPEKRLGDDATWDKAEEALREACEISQLEYEMNPGEGAFYGPKLEFVLKDCLGRSWQCGTIQVDFQLPGRLGAVYMDEKGERLHPVMLHRAILGSLERFIGILIENFAGDLPLWLNPSQVRILPISEKFQEYCTEAERKIKEAGLICEVDTRNEKIGKKIRDGEKDKVPYLLIIGEKEVESGKASIRKRKVGEIGSLPLDEIAEKLKLEVFTKGTSPLA